MPENSQESPEASWDKAADSWDTPAPLKPEASSRPLEERISGLSTNDTPATDSKTNGDLVDVSDSQQDGANEKQGGSTLQEPEYDVQVKLSDIQADPDNPLYSAKSFEDLGLSQEILNGIYSLNFRKPSKIQERALPLLLKNPPTNMIGQSQSGTGKTAAFVLNMLARIDTSTLAPQALVLSPSRELARQIMGVVQTMGQFVQGLKVTQAILDLSQRGKKFEGQIIIGTPGTVMDQIRRKTLQAVQIKVLVLDEADNMLDQQGLGDQCTRVKSMLPRNVQFVLFSATFPDHVTSYADHFAPNSNQLTLKHEELTVEGIKQLYMDCDSEQHKYDVLVKLYGLMTIGSSIIFVKRRDTAAEIERRMNAEGHTVASLTGALEGASRDGIIDKFRHGQAKVLITTNVLSRGIDVQSVSLVINYDIPDKDGNPDPETYLHRIGRTGRFGRVGVAISFVYNKESWEMLKDITNYFGVYPTKVPTDDWDLVEDMVKKVIRSSRAGSNMQMT